jgi:hypothetical protein
MANKHVEKLLTFLRNSLCQNFNRGAINGRSSTTGPQEQIVTAGGDKRSTPVWVFKEQSLEQAKENEKTQWKNIQTTQSKPNQGTIGHIKVKEVKTQRN